MGHSGDRWSLKQYNINKLCIVKQCFWIQIKFIAEDSNAINTIITTV
jgi:hypothetical protein